MFGWVNTPVVRKAVVLSDVADGSRNVGISSGNVVLKVSTSDFVAVAIDVVLAIVVFEAVREEVWVVGA